jgi:hypothetical protein
MGKIIRKSAKKSFSKEYERFFKSQPTLPILPPSPQWTAKGDYFVKFSLYKETPSIASPSTSSLLNS